MLTGLRRFGFGSTALALTLNVAACASERPTFGLSVSSTSNAGRHELDSAPSVSAPEVGAAPITEDGNTPPATDAGPTAPPTDAQNGDATTPTDTGTPDTSDPAVTAEVEAGPYPPPDASPTASPDAAAITHADDAGEESPSVCGDGFPTGSEVCDDRVPSNELGACNPECTGRYTKKLIRRSTGIHGTNLGGPAGADEICTTDFGPTWKALITASTRRATVTPFIGDGQLDWVLHKYTYYFNEENMLIWRTDTVALLGARLAQSQPLLAPLFDPFSEPGGRYPWSGYNPDWTIIPSCDCSNWSSTNPDENGCFITQDLATAASERCSAEPWSFLLCVEQ